jgi:hypothetical protein
MGKFVELVGRSVGIIADADTEFGAVWNPSISGRLKKVKVLVGAQAVTSVVFNGYIKLSCATFGGVDMYAPFFGVGLPYAATFNLDGQLQETECDLVVTAGKPVKVFYYHSVVPTTPEITVFAEIEG